MKKACLILPLLIMMACSDGDLAKVSKQMLVVSKAIGQVQTDAIEANRLGIIDENITANILNVCLKVNVLGKQVDTVLRSIEKLDPASRLQLVNLITPISQALDPTKIEFIAGIKNPETKQKIEAGFLLARSTISAVQLIIATSELRTNPSTLDADKGPSHTNPPFPVSGINTSGSITAEYKTNGGK